MPARRPPRPPDRRRRDRRRLAGQADRVLAKGSTGLNELARELRALIPATEDTAGSRPLPV